MSSRFSLPRSLAVFAFLLAPALFAQTKLLEDKFNDGSRTDLNPTSSAAWYSSAAGNTVFTNGTGGANGTLALDNGSSRTLVGYFNAIGSPVTIGLGDTLTLDVIFTIDGAPVVKSNGLIFGLLQSVTNTNPAAVPGTGYTSGPRVSGDFGSSNPSSHVFGAYTGYAAWTALNGGSNPVTIRRRNALVPANDGLDNASASWTQIGSASGTGTAPTVSTDFHAILTLNRTAGNAMNLNYKITQGISTLVNYSTSEATTTYTTFDTVNIYMASGTLTGDAAAHLTIRQVNVTLSNGALPPAPTINTPPASQTVNVNDPVTFTVDATGTGPLTYEWRKDGGAPIAGATGSTFSIANAQLSDQGNYTVTVTNAGGSTTSTPPATLTVNAGAVAPNITKQPTPQTVGVGKNTSFTVEATGTAPLSYQWYFGPDPIPGATSATLNLNSVTLLQAGNYSVVVTNSVTSVPSNPALLTVVVPPSISAPPVGGTVTVGSPFTFNVGVDGTPPFTYVWRKNGTPIPGATGASYTIGSVQTSDQGNYSVVVTNAGDSATSADAFLGVNAPPLIVSNPASQLAIIGGSVSLKVTVSGTPPFTYEWRKDGNLLSETSDTLTLNNVQVTAAGNYTVKITNAYGFANSTTAVITTGSGLADSAYNLTGFATLGSGTTGGGVIPESDPAYVKVTNALEFANAIALSNKTANAVKVIEIMNDLNLGWLEIGATVQAVAGAPLRSHATPKLHPTLIASGVSICDIKAKTPLTIFSANGATIRHVNFNLKGTSNIMIRNLKFDEMWEWDEASKGDYDSNDWDFITLSNGSPATNIWIDHCTFTKAYDGITDFKAGTQYVTISWCRYLGDDGATNANSPVRKQIAALEANKASYPMYNFLRTNGFSVEEIIAIIQGHDKGHLLGSNSLDPDNATLSGTFHHLWLQNVWDRAIPRLRAGNVHDYNLYIEDSLALVAKRLRDQRASALTTALRNTLNNTYSFNPPLNGAISTEGGAVLVENSVYRDCITPLRNNQTDPSNPVYTGKIKSLNSLYSFLNSDGTTTTVLGDSTDAGNPMGPFQAAIIPFSFNGFASVPYTYAGKMDDPLSLPDKLAIGAGAGRVVWAKENWLKTTYAEPTLNTYAGWLFIYGVPAGQNGFTADPDGDGISNLLEYYLGTNPMASDPAGSPAGKIEGSDFVFRFTHAKARTGVTVQVQISTDLVTWSPAPAPQVESDTPDIETLVVKLPMTTPRVFARLVVTSP